MPNLQKPKKEAPAELLASATYESRSRGGRNSAKAKREKRAEMAKMEDIRACAYEVCFRKSKAWDPETETEHEVLNYMQLMRHIFDLALNQNGPVSISATKLLTELMFFTPENQKNLLTIHNEIQTAMPANIDDFETLRRLRKTLLLADDGIEDAEVIDDKDEDKPRDTGRNRAESGPGTSPAED